MSKADIKKYYWLLNTQRCIGCETCVIACKQENQLLTGIRYRQVYRINSEQYPALPALNISISCNHCEKPVCLKNCPAKAYRKEDGLVIHEAENCIGCKYCTWVCPYDAPQYVAVKGKVEKCNLCYRRLKNGQPPACVEACVTGALQLVENLDELPAGIKNLTDIPGLTRKDTRPKARIIVKKALTFPKRG